MFWDSMPHRCYFPHSPRVPSLAESIKTSKLATMPLKTVLITGCSEGGLGAALAKAFQEQGYHVFATLRNPAKAGSIAGEHGTNTDVLPLDTTSKDSIDACLETVRKTTGGKLDILVNNNAGTGTAMPLLHMPVDEAKAIYEVNVWGTLSLVQAFSPLLLESKGTIMNICSIVGAAKIAWQGKRFRWHFQRKSN